MSNKYPNSFRRARLAPLAAAVALLTLGSGAALAQQQVSVIQNGESPVTANNSTSVGLTSFPNNGTVNLNRVSSDSSGNIYGLADGDTGTLPPHNQPLATPTVTITQDVSAAVSATTNGAMGVNANAVKGKHDGGALSVSSNAATANATGNASVGTMLATNNGQLDISTPASTTVTQEVGATAPVSASTDQSQVGIRLKQTKANATNAFDHLSLNVADNQVSASAQGNTTTAGITAVGSGIALGAAVSSTVTQRQLGNVSADSNVDVLGTQILGTSNRPMTDSNLSVGNNRVTAVADGNQQSSANVLQSSGDITQTDGDGLTTSAVQRSRGTVSASSTVGTLGISNRKNESSGNHYTVSGNTVAAQASANTGSNLSSATAAGTITGLSATTDSTQVYNGNGVSAKADVKTLGVQTQASTNDTSVISGNLVQAQAQGSAATNQSLLSATQINDSIAQVDNQQNHKQGAITADASVNQIGSSSTSLSGGSVTVSDNRANALASGASARNTASLTASGSIDPSKAEVKNHQIHTQGKVAATAGAGLVGASTNSASDTALAFSGNQFNASASSQTVINQASVQGSELIEAGAGILNTQTHEAGNVLATVANMPLTSPAPTPDPMHIGLQADHASGGSLTVSGNLGAADAIVNQASNQVHVSGSSHSDSLAVLDNQQSVNAGNATALTLVNLGLKALTAAAQDTARANGHELVVSNNVFSANASQNQADNSLVLKADNSVNGAPLVDLVNTQTANGNTKATTEMNILTGSSDATTPSGNTTVSNNQANSMARANVANNQLTLSAGTQANDVAPSLQNTQTNNGAVSATSKLAIPAGAATRLDGDITINGNQAASVAAGNTSLNNLQASAGTAFNGLVALNNNQSNNGAVTASTSLNATGSSRGTALNLSGNIASATAVGNNAENQLRVTAQPGQLMASATLTSTQVNTGNVTATVDGSIIANGVAGTNNVSVSGNRSAAVAVGNRSSSSMTLGVQ